MLYAYQCLVSFNPQPPTKTAASAVASIGRRTADRQTNPGESFSNSTVPGSWWRPPGLLRCAVAYESWAGSTSHSSQSRSLLSGGMHWSFSGKHGRIVAFRATQRSSSCSFLLSQKAGFLSLCWSMDQNGLKWLIFCPYFMIEPGRP